MAEIVSCSQLNAFGGHLTCRYIRHDRNHRCNEFVVEKRPIKIHRWIGTSVTVSVASYLLKLYAMSSYIQFFIVICLCLAIAFLIHCRVQKESVLVISSIGLQMTTTFVSGRNVSFFVGSSNITGVVINEVITMHCVLYYLSLLTRSPKQELIPLFTYTMPRLEFLRRVYVVLNSMVCQKRKLN